jgi:membrane fusion protein, multidrug efflux system
MTDVTRYMKAAAALSVVLATASCGGGDAEANQGTSEAPPARVVNVEVAHVASEAFAEFVDVTGVVQANRDVVVAAEEAGVVREIIADRGRAVAVGQPIARLDDRLLRAQYDQAKAEAALAEETWERQRRLWEEDQIGSELAYLRARYAAETAAAQARVLATRLERTIVRAPIAGVLDDRFVEVGASVTAGSPVARIVDAGTVKVVAGVPERYAADIRAGGEAVVTFDHLLGREFRAQTRYAGASLNEQNRTFPVELVVRNENALLKPGMVAKVRVGRRTVEGAVLIPREAVLRSEAGFNVYVVTERGGQQVVEARPVVTGTTAGGRVLIESGLEAGERVVVVGQQQLAGGELVRVVNERGATAP